MRVERHVCDRIRVIDKVKTFRLTNIIHSLAFLHAACENYRQLVNVLVSRSDLLIRLSKGLRYLIQSLAFSHKRATFKKLSKISKSTGF